MALFLANCGGGMFGGTQSTLVMMAVPTEQHGVAMGVLSLAIGAQAAGMLGIGAAPAHASSVHRSSIESRSLTALRAGVQSVCTGEVGQFLSPGTTMLLFCALGVATQALFSLLLPDCRRMLAPREPGPKSANAAAHEASA